MEQQSKQLSHFVLDRYHLGYLSREEEEQVKTLLEEDKDARDYLAHIRKEEAALPALQWERVEATSATSSPDPGNSLGLIGWLQRWYWGLGAVCAGAAVFMLFIWSPSLKRIRMKGAVEIRGHFSIFAQKEQDKSRLLKSKGLIYTSDRLRLRFAANRALYVMVVSVSPKGEVSLYWPYPQQDAQLLPVDNHLLPKGDKSIPLDRSVGWELFVAIGSKKPFGFGEVKQKLLGHIQAGKTLHTFPKLKEFDWQTQLLLRKVP